ncbi:MAG: hypothetical protein KAS62_11850 [Candidatus Delongbacteria bacterium]|nr:hypothetical protein [Candidatus Delongbacteria bacterium]
MNSEVIWKEYQEGKQTYGQLAKKYNCSRRTIQRKIDLHQVSLPDKTAREVIVLMDTTYWGRNFGMMLFKDATSKENLLKYYVKTETNVLYKQGIKELQERGYTIVAIVCDGRKGLINSFDNIPVQMCQFHQASIIRRYLTKRPKLPASIELKAVVDLMKETDKESFEGALNEWFLKWEPFLNERTVNEETGKSFYTHKRLRSAYRSLKTNMPYLFTYLKYPDLKIPNTTNSLEGFFSGLKTKLRIYSGLKRERKIKVIDYFLYK